MNRKELIELGKKLLAKGRTPTEIYRSLEANASSKEDVNAALDEVFSANKKKKQRNPERVKTLLQANRVKLNNEYSLKALYRIAFTILIIGVIVYALSSERVNQNEIFGWITLVQGLSILVLYHLVKKRELYDLLLLALVLYWLIYFVEIAVWGIPNDLLKAYYVEDSFPYEPVRSKHQIRIGAAQLIGFLFPFFYIVMKVFVGCFIFVVFRNHKKYNDLPEDIKNELNYFR